MLFRSGKRVTNAELLNIYYENRQKAIDSNFENYESSSVYTENDMQSGIKFIYYLFGAKLRDLLFENEIDRPKFNIKRWGDDFYIRVGKAELFIEKEEFMDAIWGAYSAISNEGIVLDSPKFTFIVVVLKSVGEVYIDFNKTENIPEAIRNFMNDGY